MSKISEIINTHRPSLAGYEDLYRHLHANPELSFQERSTAALMKARVEAIVADTPSIQTTIHTDIGSHGLAAVLRNGADTPTVLLRADMDALPVEEKTGLPYASTTRATAVDGAEKPVMHACGHDVHMTALLAAAELLCRAHAEWEGTLVLCFQPAEELGKGAQAMVEGGLYERVPVPDVVVGGHVNFQKAGTIGTRRGLMASAADSYNLTIHGRPGHASQPHRTCDPIVTAAHTITRLQTIASRETDPQDAAVVSVGYIHAGDAVNIIPAAANLGLDIRSFSQDTRRRVLAAVRRIADAESLAANAPQPPELRETRTFPLLVNEERATEQVERVFAAHFGGEYDAAVDRMAMSEDCGILAEAVGRPSVFFVYGGTDVALWERLEREGGDEGVREGVPVNHSAFFAPAVPEALRVGLDGYAGGALAFLAKGGDGVGAVA